MIFVDEGNALKDEREDAAFDTKLIGLNLWSDVKQEGFATFWGHFCI